MNKKLFSLILALMIVFSSVASFAAPLDLINKVDSTKDYSFTQFLNNSANFNYVAGNMGEYLIKAPNGNLYNVDEVNAALTAGAKDFAEAIAGLTPVEEPSGELEVVEVSAITTTKLEVKLNQKVDQVAAANFSIAGATVNSATLNADKTIVTLGVAGLVANESYTLTTTGITIDANVQPDVVKAFTMPAVSTLFTPTLKFEEGVDKLKADGASSTLVTYELKDAEGNIVVGAEDVEVAFTTTFGSFGEQRVSVQNGVATLLLTSEFLTADRTAQLTATIVNAADQSLIGLTANKSILMTPNPEAGQTETVGATMTDAESNQSDRVIVYFNKDVNVNDYLNPLTGAIDPALATVNVRETSTSVSTGNVVTVKGLLPVPGNAKALQVLLDVEANVSNALTDNADVWIQFADRTKTVDVDRNITFKNTDVRKPSMLSVTNEGLNKLVVTFSEAVINNASTNSAETLANWSIDGTLLTNTSKWGAGATVTVGVFNPLTGEDQRNVVTITLGTGKYFTSGDHSIQAANIGDWAMLTDNNNIMNTQTLDFNIPIDNELPVATVTVQSPEQWLVTYNKDVNQTDAQFAAALKLQKYNSVTAAWENDADVTSYNTIGTLGAKNTDTNLDIAVTKIDGNKFLVEADYDWSEVHNKTVTGKNYFNTSYRLFIPANTVSNVSNGKKNAEETLTLAGQMLNVDAQSPKIDADIKQVDGVAGLLGAKVYEVTMSEPVKLNTGANLEGITLAQGQTALPVPTAEFVKKDGSKTIQGKIDTSFVDKYDKVLRAYAVDTDGTTHIDLEAGEWTLIVRSISDDYGNTAASATKDFTVVGTTPVLSDFKVLWAFADIDTDWVVEATDGGEGDSNYDYVVVKFNKAIATSGDFKNVTKTANYTFNGQPLPTGTQILSNIDGYDDYDEVIDSITIRLPQGTLQTKNAPHNLNISMNIESATGEKIGLNGGEITLPYNNNTWNANMATDIAGDLSVATLVDAVQSAKDAMDDGIDAGEIDQFESDFVAAQTAITALPAESLVKAQYQAKIDELKAEVIALSDFATFMVPGNFDVTVASGGTPGVGLVIDAGIEVTDFSVKLPGSTTKDRYTVTKTGEANGDTVTFTAATGVVTATYDDSTSGADETSTVTITIKDNFWGVSDTVTVTVVDGNGITPNSVIVNND